MVAASLGFLHVPGAPGTTSVGEAGQRMSVELTTLPRRQRRGGSMVLNAACLLITLLALLFILPAAFGLSRYVITGGSMTGTISRGSVVFEETVPVADLAVGDIITYLPPAESGLDDLVTHRIVSIDGDTFRTKGDANPDVDPWTFQLSSTVQPRVVADVPYIGYLFIALADRGTRMLVIGVPAAIIALLSLRELTSGLRRRSRPTSEPTAESAQTPVEPAVEPAAPAGPPAVDIPVARTPARSAVARPRALG